MTQPRRFHLQRDHDVTGVSGVGRVANGVLWPDGTVTIRWTGDRPSTVHWDDLAHAHHVHGHGGHTRIVWADPEPTVDDYPMADGCPHCPDGHTSPDHGQPWGVHIGPERYENGQPIRIYVQRTGGAHVAESDAEWIRTRLNGSQP
ncbi:hypothetical protein [Streptomyces sp. 6-11-2]|uniref:hypothetical protein n=1 Tax=Streptomyces sp. 6-11-2 TaxID=2585753 RepID=UPI00116B9D62|nr:hypothetical protein [Streptomyces sp. 6-11-2]GED89355.1 hypothetical protein TNCT6_64400 [Streptomyces sp. 6-11-2]